jgi:hypothetical protein
MGIYNSSPLVFTESLSDGATAAVFQGVNGTTIGTLYTATSTTNVIRIWTLEIDITPAMSSSVYFNVITTNVIPGFGQTIYQGIVDTVEIHKGISYPKGLIVPIGYNSSHITFQIGSGSSYMYTTMTYSVDHA